MKLTRRLHNLHSPDRGARRGILRHRKAVKRLLKERRSVVSFQNVNDDVSRSYRGHAHAIMGGDTETHSARAQLRESNGD